MALGLWFVVWRVRFSVMEKVFELLATVYLVLLVVVTLAAVPLPIVTKVGQ
jgi:hypothetical protein